MTIAGMDNWGEVLRYKSEAELLQDLHEINDQFRVEVGKVFRELDLVALAKASDPATLSAKATAARELVSKGQTIFEVRKDRIAKLERDIARSKRFYQAWGRAPLRASARSEVN